MPPGIRKSEFPGVTSAADGDTFDFVTQDGTNLKIKKSDLVATLGLTGSIKALGDVAAVPILQKSGSVNEIRSLTPGPGIKASINGPGGITIEQNLVQESTGIPTIDDLTLAAPLLPSWVPGAGISISKINGVFTITATGVALPATKAIAINVEGDWPTPVAGEFPLAAGTVYIVSNDIVSANRYKMAAGTSIVGYSSIAPVLTYTGTGTMFTGVDVSVGFFDVALDCPNGKVFDFSDTVGGLQIFQADTVRVASCTTIGDFDSMRTVSFAGFLSFAVATDGILMKQTVGPGTLARFVNMSLKSPSATFVGVDLGAAVFETIRVSGCIFEGVAGAIALKGAAANANLTATGVGEVLANKFTGLITPVSGIDLQKDVQWVAIANGPIQDTRPDSLSGKTASTPVVIAVTGTPVKIAGVWNDDNSAHFTVDGTGRVTYIGKKPLPTSVAVTVTSDPVSGSNKDFKISVGVNGTVVAASAVPGRASAGDLVTRVVIWQVTFQENDFIEVFLQNDTDVVDFDVTHAVLRLN